MARSGVGGGRYAWQLVAVVAFVATAAVAVVLSRPRAPAIAVTSAACTTAALHAQVGLAAATTGTAFPWTVYYRLELTNVSGRTCVMDGYPAVEAFSGARPVGSPAALDTSVRPVAVTLVPGATAYTLLRYTTDQFGSATCRQVTVPDLRIALPREDGGMLVHWGNPACSRLGPSFLSVQAIQSRIGAFGSPHP
jgi:hypothetical protein